MGCYVADVEITFIRYKIDDLQRSLSSMFPKNQLNTKLMKILLCILCQISLNVDSTHQRWWLYGCRCSTSRNPRNNLKDMIINSYKGLFLAPADLSRLPVVKLPESQYNPNPRHGGRHGSGSYVDNLINLLPNLSHVVECCETEYSHEVINKTVFNNQQIDVVHFDNVFQFVPTGKCKFPNSSCGQGGRGRCIQQFRHHWLLVWDRKVSRLPPVEFLPVEVPSFCHCLNVGRGRGRGPS